MDIQRIDPLADPRWPEFVERHPDASIFHTRGWLEALRRTYGYEPVVYTTCGPGTDLTNGIVLCRVNSWLTGKRLVSLPFSDHCQPLVTSTDDLPALLDALRTDRERMHLKSVELKPLRDDISPLTSSNSFGKSCEYHFHQIDLTPEQDELLSKFHRTCVRVKIGRAEREHLTYETGRTEELVSQFYSLLMMTRRKHQVPPPPIEWFKNVAECLGDRVSIRVAYKDGLPVSSIVTAVYNKVCLYKYTGINQEWAHTGATQALVWQAITEAKAMGAEILDFGRTELDNASLVEYKERWASQRSSIVYHECPQPLHTHDGDDLKMRTAKAVFSRLPDRALRAVGRVLYKHIA